MGQRDDAALECSIGRPAEIAMRAAETEAIDRIPMRKSCSNVRYFKGLVFPLKAGNKPSEDG
jgi:hypothetical protein